MAVIITDFCINCDACIDECPATAIVSADDSPIENAQYTYVKPEKCIECVDSSVPKCAYVCPSEGSIVWDMPFTADFQDFYMDAQESGIYKFRIHKKLGMFTPQSHARPFRESISLEQRKSGMEVEI